jgi:UDP-N-acetylglucosamine acyltransferase
MNRVHETASVAAGARLGEGVRIGAYAVIEDDVEIGAATTVGPHAVVHPLVRIGGRNRIYPHAVLGGDPQDLSFAGRDTWLEIGDDNVFREYVTVHRATSASWPTKIGSNCYLMAYCHVAHDCQIGDDVTLANSVTLGGHVQIGHRVMLGGLVALHQFVRVGAYAMVGGHIGLRKDVLPFSLVSGEPARHYRLNVVGLRRAGITGERYRVLEAAFRSLRKGRPLNALPDTQELALLRAWLSAPSKRGLTGFAGVNGEIAND